MNEAVPARTQRPDQQIWAIAGPAIIANSSTPLVGLVDTWVIGHLPGAVHLAAVGVGAAIFSFLFWAFGFLRMSSTGLVAQAHGRCDHKQVARIVIRSSMLSMLLGVGLILLQMAVFQVGTWALKPPDTALPLLSDYFFIRIWSAPAVLFVYAINGYLIGTAQAKAALALQLLLNISNGLLNLLFVLGFEMGVAGIALGSLLAEWIAAVFGLYLFLRNFKQGLLLDELKARTTWQLSRMKKLISANGYIFFRTLILMTALAMITRQAGQLGEVSLAANQILNVFFLLISLGLDGFAYAAEALAGAAYGRDDRREFRFWVVRTTWWAAAAASLYALVFLLLGPTIIESLTDIVSVQQATSDALLAVVLLPIFAVWCFQFDGIFIGATEGRGMLITMAVAFVTYIIALETLTSGFGLIGLWTAVVIFMTTRGLAQLLYYPTIERKLALSAKNPA